MANEDDTWKATTAPFLVEEYKLFFTAFLANEESGERRVSIFLTVASGAVAVLGIAFGLTDKDSQLVLSDESLRGVAALVLGSLSLVGLATLLRIVKRNTVSDEYKTAMDTIRAIFRQSDRDRLKGYNPFVKFRRRGPDAKSSRKLWGVLPVGLVLLTSTINAGLVTGTFIAATLDIGETKDALIAVTVLFASLLAQLVLADFAEISIKKRNDAYKIGAPDLARVYRRGGMAPRPPALVAQDPAVE